MTERRAEVSLNGTGKFDGQRRCVYFVQETMMFLSRATCVKIITINSTNAHDPHIVFNLMFFAKILANQFYLFFSTIVTIAV